MPHYRAAWLLPISQPPIQDAWFQLEAGRIVAFGGARDRRTTAGEIDLGQVVVRGRCAGREREHCGDGRRAWRGASRQLFTATDGFVVAEHDNRCCRRVVGSNHGQLPSAGMTPGPAEAAASVKSIRRYRELPTTLAVSDRVAEVQRTGRAADVE